jgi:hypothetical protein
MSSVRSRASGYHGRVAEPDKALTLRPIQVGRRSVPADEVVWVFERSGTTADVEYRNERGTVPADALVAYHGMSDSWLMLQGRTL